MITRENTRGGLHHDGSFAFLCNCCHSVPTLSQSFRDHETKLLKEVLALIAHYVEKADTEMIVILVIVP